MLPRLSVSPNRRFLVAESGQPTFYQGDTAWELLHRLDREQTLVYLDDRAGKGFNVVQTVILAERDGLNRPNAQGDRPLIDNDPTRPNEAYFEHVDWVTEQAAQRGIYLGLLPTWGCHVLPGSNGEAPVIDRGNAGPYGRFLGERYREADLIWILGGDRRGTNLVSLWRAMAEGLRGAGADQLITFHPPGVNSSSQWVHHEDWLDFNMIQSGHSRRFEPNWKLIARDGRLEPTKPTLDGEICYEEHPIGFNKVNGRFTDHDVRCAAYWSVFAGACGVTYGAAAIWQMSNGEDDCVTSSHSALSWRESLVLPASSQMQHLKRLVMSRPYLDRVGDDTAVGPVASDGSDHPAVSRDGTPGRADATWLMIYLPAAKPWARFDTHSLPAPRLRVWWFNPRTGQVDRQEELDNSGSLGLGPVDSGPDWVLVVDDAAAGYGVPGA